MASERQTVGARWTDSITNLLVGLMVDEVKKGNRPTSTFNKVGWKNIQTEFSKQTGFQYNIVQLRNKVNKLRKQYGSFQKLISQSGFGWDNVNNRVVVDDPSIWESHIKENAEWAKFKKDGFPQYPDLCIVFGGIYATGNYAVRNRNAENLMLSEEDDNGDDYVSFDNGGRSAYGDDASGNAYGDDAGGNTDGFSGHQIGERVGTSDNVATSVQHKLDRTPNTKRRRKSNQSGISETCKAIQDYLKVRTSQSGSGSANSRVTPPPEDPFSVSTVIGVLLSMDEIEQDVYNKAVERACVSAAWREAFIQTPPERRNGLLQCL